MKQDQYVIEVKKLNSEGSFKLTQGIGGWAFEDKIYEITFGMNSV